MATLETLISMGFPEASAARAIEVTGNRGVEAAMEWLLAHSDDAEQNQTEAVELSSQLDGTGSTDNEKTEAGLNDSEVEASAEAEPKEAKSLKCDECGKLFRTSEEVEFHAVKSGHSSFSESTEEKAPLTEDQRKQKLLALEEKMKARRKAKAEEEERDALEREKKRIEMGKGIAEIKRKQEEEEMKKLAEQKRREKLEDKLARQRVKAQIEADKEARRQKLAEARGEPAPLSAATAPSAPAPSSTPKNYDNTRIQFRLPSGPPVVQTFGAKEPLFALDAWLRMNHPPSDPSMSILLSTSFPRRVFSLQDMDKPLNSLDLVPSAALLVQYK